AQEAPHPPPGLREDPPARRGPALSCLAQNGLRIEHARLPDSRFPGDLAVAAHHHYRVRDRGGAVAGLARRLVPRPSSGRSETGLPGRSDALDPGFHAVLRALESSVWTRRARTARPSR